MESRYIGSSNQDSTLTSGMFNDVLNTVDMWMKMEPSSDQGVCSEIPTVAMPNLPYSNILYQPYDDAQHLLSDVLLSPDSTQTQYVASDIPLPTCKLPCLEEYTGPYSFEIQLNSETSEKHRWLYSHPLNKLFVTMNSKIPIQFKWVQPAAGLRVRALPVYISKESFEDAVLRCPNHSSQGEDSNKDFVYVNHVIRCDHEYVEYHMDEDSGRLSVVVPMDKPQPGTDWVTAMYSFMCKNSCIVGMNRRAIEVIFTLERLNGEVVGRKSMKVRICSCPKRDKEKEEADAQKSPPGKRCMTSKTHSHEQNKKKKMENDGEMVMLEVSKKNAAQIATYSHDLVCGRAIREQRPLTQQEKTEMEKYKQIMNTYKLPAKTK